MKNNLLRAEAAFWMSRMHVNSVNLWLVLIGWCAGSGFNDALDLSRLLALCVFVTFVTAALQIVNDILDADGDEVTAPYLPLPSGLLGVRAAYAWSGTYLVVALAALYLCVPSLVWMPVIIGTTCLATLLVFLYSRLKSTGVLGSLIIALPLALPLAWAWLLAGREHPLLFAVLFAYSLLTFVVGNIIAALRDVDLDGLVGNETLPVQVGGPQAFRTAVRIASATWLLVPVVAFMAPHPMWGLVLAVPGAALLLGSYGKVRRTLEEPARGRVRRMRDLYPTQISEHLRHLAVLAAIDPVFAIVAALILHLSAWGGSSLYARRLISGGLRQALTGDVTRTAMKEAV